MMITKKDFEEAKTGSIKKWESAPRADLDEMYNWFIEIGVGMCTICKLCSLLYQPHKLSFSDWCDYGCPLHQNKNDICTPEYEKIHNLARDGELSEEIFINCVDKMLERIRNMEFEDIPEQFKRE